MYRTSAKAPAPSRFLEEVREKRAATNTNNSISRQSAAASARAPRSAIKMRSEIDGERTERSGDSAAAAAAGPLLRERLLGQTRPEETGGSGCLEKCQDGSADNN